MTLKRQEISEAVTELGWRLVLGRIQAFVPVSSLAAAAEIAGMLAVDGGDSLLIDLRKDRVFLSLQPPDGVMTPLQIELARRIAKQIEELGLRLEPALDEARSVQVLEIAIDALDIARIRPFWQAIMGYQDDPADTNSPNGLIDPLGQGPTIWFQQMDEPRPQRNRIHFDVNVPHEGAARRIREAVDAGGTLRSEDAAPAFWILADAEGNEACICTWQGRG
jgi:4a-hydroxytetrahydrobiopterin dehydratase